MRTVRFAMKQITPLLLSYVPIGLAAGILLYQAGYGVLWAAVSAFFIYAGSMQIVMVSLLTAGIPVPMIALMTLFINARHIFYGISFVERYRRMGKLYPYMILTLTDETYSLLCAIEYPEDVDGQRADFLIQLSCHLCWTLSCVAGALLGVALPVDFTGIEFSATALFTAVAVNQWRQFPSRVPAITGFVSGVFFWLLLGPDNFILPALSVSVVTLMLLKSRLARRETEEVPS